MQKGLRIGVDVDGVLRDWLGALLVVFRANYPDSILEGHRVTWDLKNINMPWAHIRYLFSVKHVQEIYGSAKPYPHALDDFNALKTYCKLNDHQLVCVSHQWDETLTETMLWLGRHGFSFEEIHFTSNKHTLNLNVLIDDSPKNYDAWVDAGHVDGGFFLFDQEYNQDCRAKHRITRITQVIPFL